ncbi:dihydroorotate dehydrogenase B catalytic subunit [Megamonas hypermegale]|jgi:dihydroorotate dehydrogenase (NAD+) catalytic subunit|uniref:dihydroorotate dehydrogenase n=1 Tax=Megamonas hypermegale TaxID=158847 RepID=UPI000B37B478|nr:dihydroorotate dehydrogenase [Megamonas hypermegale]MBM6761006.1 dihydroorotate dehydrogenase [Megamonas hypermegale]MBM6833098.1 dihydroorotate dehydrogenase [Megamonas hypermegale]OUO41192.1 dihydroorotate dehydrogenase B catalytic subunit [Megamonas hypermegale]
MNLAVKIGNLELKNPVMGASGTFGFGKEYEDFLDVNEIGAIVTKGVTPKPRAGNPGVRIAETPAGMLNCIGLENPGVDAFICDILPKIKKYNTAVIVNISASTVEEYAEMAWRLDIDGVDAVEVNISCPNVKEGGIVFGTDPKAAAAVTRAVKTHTSKTVIVKLSPNVTDITVMAKAVEEAGADAISMINTLTGMVIDINTRKPLLGNITGGLSGPAVKPVAVRMVWQVAKAVKIPIIGMGGITCAEDAIEFMLAGATAVAVGAYNFVDPSALKVVADGIADYMKKHNIEDVNELVGAVQA